MSVMSSAQEGERAYENGAFYMGQDSSEGNSQSFIDIQERGAELGNAIANITDILSSKIAEVKVNIATAEENKAAYKEQLIQVQNEITGLYNSTTEDCDYSSQISSLEDVKLELQKKIENCAFVINALNSDIKILDSLQNQASVASTALE